MVNNQEANGATIKQVIVHHVKVTAKTDAENSLAAMTEDGAVSKVSPVIKNVRANERRVAVPANIVVLASIVDQVDLLRNPVR